MILTEKKKEALETLTNLRKQYEYLTSSQTLKMISEKQFRESEERIIAETDKIIEEWGFTADDLGEAPMKSQLDELFDEVLTKLDSMVKMVGSDFDLEVHRAIERIFDGTDD